MQADREALKGLIDGWMRTPEFQVRMYRFFQNAFQQVQINQTSFVDQLFNEGLSNARLLAKVTDSFALTALQLTLDEDKPFTSTETTDRYLLTPPLATFLAYLDNRHVSDQQRALDFTLAAYKDFTVTLSNSSGPIPIEQSLVYVQPLYLAAAEQGALPELRRVVVAYGNQIAMEPTLEAALARVFGGRVRGEEAGGRPVERGPSEPSGPAGAAISAGIQRAWEAWQRGQEALRRGDWTTYGQEQKKVEEALRQLQGGR